MNLKLAEYISGKTVIPSEYVSSSLKVAMMGSILPWALDKDTIVWGSGCLNSHDPLWRNVEKPKRVCAVRGPLTRNVLIEHGIECPKVYGDPALCFPRYYQPHVEHQDRIGVIPHMTSLAKAYELCCELSKNVMIVNPKEFITWHEFIDEICSCKVVFTASLHGLIIADAYGVPNAWVSFTGEEHSDHNFKFHDYFLSVGKDIKSPINIQDIDFKNIERYIDAWRRPKIDVDKILKVCPLK